MIDPQLVSTLRSNPLFAAMSDSEVAAITRRAFQKTHCGAVAFSEGEPCNGLHVIVSGKVRIFKSSRAGREQVLSIEGPGASVAELPVFDGEPFPASAATVTDSAILFVSRSDFRSVGVENPELALKLLKSSGSDCGGWWELLKSSRSPHSGNGWFPGC